MGFEPSLYIFSKGDDPLYYRFENYEILNGDEFVSKSSSELLLSLLPKSAFGRGA